MLDFIKGQNKKGQDTLPKGIISLVIIFFFIFVASVLIFQFLGGFATDEQKVKASVIKMAEAAENIEYSFGDKRCRDFKFNLPKDYSLIVDDSQISVWLGEEKVFTQYYDPPEGIDGICAPCGFKEEAAGGRYCPNNLNYNFNDGVDISGSFCLCYNIRKKTVPFIGKEFDNLIFYRKGYLGCTSTFPDKITGCD